MVNDHVQCEKKVRKRMQPALYVVGMGILALFALLHTHSAVTGRI